MHSKEVWSVYPSDVATTKYWQDEHQLQKLFEFPLEELVTFLLTFDSEHQVAAVIELEQHGNIKRAALVARRLNTSNAKFKFYLGQNYMTKSISIFLDADPEKLPSNPNELKEFGRIEYLQ